MTHVEPTRGLHFAAGVQRVLVLIALASCATHGSLQPAHGWFEQSLPDGIHAAPEGLWVASEHDIWFGASSIWHFDGVSWHETPPPRAMVVLDFLGFGRFDIWALGYLLPATISPHGVVLHWNGAGWSELAPPTGVQFGDLQAIAGTSSSDLWVWDASAEMLYHYDGAAWSGTPQKESSDAMWASSPSDVWLSGPGSLCWHFDGTSWSPYQAQPCVYGAASIWGFAPNDVWSTTANGLAIHWDGTSWTENGPYDPRDGTYVTLWGSGPSDVYVAGSLGYVAHYDGATWTKGSAVNNDLTFYKIRGSSASNIWALAQNMRDPGYVLMRYWP